VAPLPAEPPDMGRWELANPQHKNWWIYDAAIVFNGHERPSSIKYNARNPLVNTAVSSEIIGRTYTTTTNHLCG